MKILAIANQSSELNFSENELLILHAALNEICNGLDISEFETRIGASLEDATLLLQSIGNTLDRMAE